MGERAAVVTVTAGSVEQLDDMSEIAFVVLDFTSNRTSQHQNPQALLGGVQHTVRTSL